MLRLAWRAWLLCGLVVWCDACDERDDAVADGGHVQGVAGDGGPPLDWDANTSPPAPTVGRDFDASAADADVSNEAEANDADVTSDADRSLDDSDASASDAAAQELDANLCEECGADGGEVGAGRAGEWWPALGATPASGNYVYLEGELGDPIVGDRTLLYTDETAFLSVVRSGSSLSLSVRGAQAWDGWLFTSFLYGDSIDPGLYDGVAQPSAGAGAGGLLWTGEGHDCATVAGWFAIDSLSYEGSVLSAVDVRFEQRCDDGSAVLHGMIHWRDEALAGPIGPLAAPDGLWQPPAGATPATGNYVYLEGEADEPVIGDQTIVYAGLPSPISVLGSGRHAYVIVQPSVDPSWNGLFDAPQVLGEIEPGYYPGLLSFPNEKRRGGFGWQSASTQCDPRSWVMIDAIQYADRIEALDMRFEQRCVGSAGALHGKVHWVAPDFPTGPVEPPAGLWAPAAGVTPLTGNYVYLEGAAGDPVVGDRVLLYTEADAELAVSSSLFHLKVDVQGEHYWIGAFDALTVQTQLTEGYYGDVARFPFSTAVRGALAWSGQGHTCSAVEGWFVVDEIEEQAGALQSIHVRFEQRCDGAANALHGVIHWDAAQHITMSGPQEPPPWIWEPAADAIPATGTYVYLEGEPGDVVLGARTLTFTQANALIDLYPSETGLAVQIHGDEDWLGTMQALTGSTGIQPGYYRAERHGSDGKAALDWASGTGCNVVSGWITVDEVSYEGDALSSLHLRFEQHCEGRMAALHGVVQVVADDPTEPPGPVTPVPSTLWSPAPGATPFTGNYFYLEGEPFEAIVGGRSLTFTQANAVFQLSEGNGVVSFTAEADDIWGAAFQGMSTLSALEPGYYGDVRRWPFHNPVKGGLDVFGGGVGCNDLTGWFAVDEIAFEAGELSALHVRFEQHCESQAPALHGVLHWTPDDPTVPDGPTTPPDGLWRAPASSIPAAGNYVYLEGQEGDYVVGDQTLLATDANAVLTLMGLGRHAVVHVDGTWTGEFEAIGHLSTLEQGFYGDAQAYPFQNPVKGGMSWSGMSRTCGNSTGWFVVDAVSYEGDAIMALDLRFEQRCLGSTAPLHGQIHYERP